ncbi:MAG: prolipoprotein diacylglyceryl transferase [Actinomycetes bacterium]
MLIASIPSPSSGVLHLGPLPLRGYALMVILGIVAAVLIGDRRWVARGGRTGTVGEMAVWAVPAGLIGARIYHVATDPELYFAKGKNWVGAFEIWNGGLAIWGAIAGGVLGAWFALHRRGIPLAPMADAVAPALAVAQAVGRWGNYFNQELYGRVTHLPWALEIDPSNRPSRTLSVGLYHPTFLYESFWDLGVAGLVIWADRRYRLGHGRAFALYVAAYTAGRAWIEYLRVDQANHFLGLRLNDYVSIVVFLAAAGYFVVRRNSSREEPDSLEPAPETAPAAA